MKFSKLSLTFLGAALLFSSSAFAGETNKAKVRFVDKLSVDGKALNPGAYTVEWTGTGPTVQVNLIQGKQTVATFPAHVAKQAAASPASGYGSSTEADGSKTLTAIYIGGKKYSFQVGQSEAKRQSNTQAAK